MERRSKRKKINSVARGDSGSFSQGKALPDSSFPSSGLHNPGVKLLPYFDASKRTDMESWVLIPEMYPAIHNTSRADKRRQTRREADFWKGEVLR